MAPGKSPAFSFYGNDFLMGTASMTLEERGAYITLLIHQWDRLAVPGDDRRALATLLGVSKTKAAHLWPALAPKFVRGIDGLWRNDRLESERQKQAAYRELQRRKGLASARNRASTEPQPSPQPKGQPKPNSSSSSSTEEQKDPHIAREGAQGPGAFEPGSLPRDHMGHALCGLQFRLCLTPKVYGKLAGKYGGPDVATALQGWVNAMEVEHATLGNYLWLEDHFTAWLRATGYLKDAPPTRNRDQKPSQTVEEILSEIDQLPKGIGR